MFFPVQGDSYFNSVVLALPMDGANNSTQFPDFSLVPKTVTRSGSTTIKTTLGYPAAYFVSATGDYLTVSSHADFAIGTGNYTVESYIVVLNTTDTNFIVDTRPGSNGAYPMLYTANGYAFFYFNGAAQITSGAGVISANTLTHIALCRSGSSTRLFVNGVQVGSTYTDSSSIPQVDWPIGKFGLGSAYYNGYIRDFIVTRAAEYTANFTPTSARQFPYYGPNKTHLARPAQQLSFNDAARRGL